MRYKDLDHASEDNFNKWLEPRTDVFGVTRSTDGRDCSPFYFIGELLAFAKLELFDGYAYKPLKFYQVHRLVRFAFFLVNIITEIVQCTKSKDNA